MRKALFATFLTLLGIGLVLTPGHQPPGATFNRISSLYKFWIHPARPCRAREPPSPAKTKACLWS